MPPALGRGGAIPVAKGVVGGDESLERLPAGELVGIALAVEAELVGDDEDRRAGGLECGEEGGAVAVAGGAGRREEVAVVEEAGGLRDAQVVERVEAAAKRVETLDGLAGERFEVGGEMLFKGCRGLEGGDVAGEVRREEEDRQAGGGEGEEGGSRDGERGLQIGGDEQEQKGEQRVAMVGEALTLREVGEERGGEGEQEDAAFGRELWAGEIEDGGPRNEQERDWREGVAEEVGDRAAAEMSV